MTNEERNTALYQKMFAEQEKFRDWLKGQPPEEILNHAYEYTVREDILLSLEYHDLSDAQADALLKSPCPLADVFRDFEKRETDHMETIWDCLESRADMLLEEQRRALRETPVYPYPASYAQEHGELEQYRASSKANAACKEAIEAAIREYYDGNSLDSQAAAQVGLQANLPLVIILYLLKSVPITLATEGIKNLSILIPRTLSVTLSVLRVSIKRIWFPKVS